MFDLALQLKIAEVGSTSVIIAAKSAIVFKVRLSHALQRFLWDGRVALCEAQRQFTLFHAMPKVRSATLL